MGRYFIGLGTRNNARIDARDSQEKGDGGEKQGDGEERGEEEVVVGVQSDGRGGEVQSHRESDQKEGAQLFVRFRAGEDATAATNGIGAAPGEIAGLELRFGRRRGRDWWTMLAVWRCGCGCSVWIG